MVMIYLTNFVLLFVSLVFLTAVFKVWRMLSDKKYLRQNEKSMIVKVVIALLNAVFSITTLI